MGSVSIDREELRHLKGDKNHRIFKTAVPNSTTPYNEGF